MLMASCSSLSTGMNFAEGNFSATVAFGLRSRHARGGPKHQEPEHRTPEDVKLRFRDEPL